MQFSRALRYQYLQISRRLDQRFLFLGGGLVVLLLISAVFLPESSETDLTPEDQLVEFGTLPNFADYSDVSQMKADFFAYLEPIVLFHNGQILRQREQLQQLHMRLAAGEPLEGADREFLLRLSAEYDYGLDSGWELEIEENLASHPIDRAIRQLLLRVDEVPMDLTVVQAAKESGWGRSRFAVEANNLFGHWCYSTGCGLVPEQRTEGAAHEVRKFASVADAIGAYMKNLNSYYTYETLRLIRAGLRSSGEPLSGAALADGLLYYSQRRDAYIDEIKTMIRQYHDFKEEEAGS